MTLNIIVVLLVLALNACVALSAVVACFRGGLRGLRLAVALMVAATLGRWAQDPEGMWASWMRTSSGELAVFGGALVLGGLVIVLWPRRARTSMPAEVATLIGAARKPPRGTAR